MTALFGLGGALLVLWGSAFLALRRWGKETNPWVAFSLPLPLALVVLLGATRLLAFVMEDRTAWMLSMLAAAAAAGILWSQRDRLPPLDPTGFTPNQWALLMTGLSGAYLYMHTRGIVGPEDDYWIHFPLISLLERGFFPPPNPFVEGLTLHGHFGRDYLLAILTAASGGDQMVATWGFNHALQVSTFFLACGLAVKYTGSRAAGILLPFLLFFGVSVGSRVGLMDTYDNNNLLVYAVLLALTVLLLDAQDAPTWGRFLFLAFLLGVYGVIYETHMILFLAVVLLACLRSRALFGRALACAVLSLALAAVLGGPIGDLAGRFLGLRASEPVTHADSYQAQRVQIQFPKSRFLQIDLERDPYRRLSYVYEGKALRGLVGPLDEGGYTFIFSPKVLMMHWLALYLGLPAGLYLWRRGNRPGLILWSFALLAYLVPGMVDFGPVHEKEYFRWEFAAGFGFAAALALALADLWERGGRPLRAVVVVVALLTMLGGERRLNKTIIEIQKAPPALARRLLSPFYPSSREWFLETEVLGMKEADLRLAAWLREKTGRRDALLTNIEGRAHWDIFRESTLVGLAGLPSYGHQSPPPWMPDGIAPFFRTANWTVFWQHLDPRALPATGATWLAVDGTPELVDRLESLESLRPGVRFEGEEGRLRAALAVERPPASGPVPELEVVGLELPEAGVLQSEVAYPVELTLSSEQAVDWEGPLGLVQEPAPGTDPGGSIRPLSLWVHLQIPAGGTARVPLYLVPHLVEGDYVVQPFVGSVDNRLGTPSKFSWSFEERVSIPGIQMTGRQGDQVDLRVEFEDEGFAVEGPVRLGIRVYDLVEERYQTPFGFDGLATLEGGLPETVEVSARYPEPAERFRLDYFLVSRSGHERRLEAGPLR